MIDGTKELKSHPYLSIIKAVVKRLGHRKHNRRAIKIFRAETEVDRRKAVNNKRRLTNRSNVFSVDRYLRNGTVGS